MIVKVHVVLDQGDVLWELRIFSQLRTLYRWHAQAELKEKLQGGRLALTEERAQEAIRNFSAALQLTRKLEDRIAERRALRGLGN